MANPKARSGDAEAADRGTHAQRRPILFEDDRMISLRFDRQSVQSAMYRADPTRLALGYTRLMMAFLLFQPVPRELLIIGLGGGSLSKYCYRHLPRTRITTVEINARVIALRDKFAIPPDDTRFRVVHADGAEFIAAHADSSDVILLDGYDAAGLPYALSSQHFYDGCAAALREGGVLVANFLRRDRHVEEYLDRMGNAFGHRILTAWSEDRGNQVVSALAQSCLPARQTLLQRASALEAEHEIAFRMIASQMISSIRPRGDRSG
ncbi:MAG: spermidine synthase [Gammaproteobacteria bacterium]|nr:spermidine synthase [Gammaproteobacteria bacterium]